MSDGPRYHPKFQSDPAAVARVLGAGSRLRTGSVRESAIVGGVVLSVLMTGSFSPGAAAHAATGVLEWAARVLGPDRPRLLPDATPPTESELAAAVRAFKREWEDDGRAPA